MMAHHNQLLFNLNVPYNPLNVVTEFHNPGPVIIERLPGREQREKQDAGGLAPVQFSVVSKEKLAFAMQLARRDMKNKIREQQQQQVQRKEGEQRDKQKVSNKTGKDVRKKNTVRNIKRGAQNASTPSKRNVNINIQKKSVRTQTPVGHGHRKLNQRGSPVLVLTSQPQPSPIQKEHTEKVAVLPAKSKPAPESESLHQKREIARLNKELQTCMMRISSLSKQVEATTAAASSPDRTATLRAGLEALFRAEHPRDEESRSEVKKGEGSSGVKERAAARQSNKVRQRRLRHSEVRGVILPARSKPHHFASASTGDRMHFTRPTESSKTKARPTHDVPRKSTTAAPVWSPPGSPRSYHRVGRLGRERRSGRLGSHGEESDEELVTGDHHGRTPTRVGEKIFKNPSAERERALDGRSGTQYLEFHRGVSNSTKSAQREAAFAGSRMPVKGHGFKISHEETKLPRFPLSERNESGLKDGRNTGIVKERISLEKSVRRKVQFGPPAGADIGREFVNHSAWVDESDRVAVHEKPRREVENPYLNGVASGSGDVDHYGDDLTGQDSGHRFNPNRQPQEIKHSRPSSVKEVDEGCREQITDLLMDEILEDEVKEFGRLDEDTMATRAAHCIQEAPTFENILQELELMEVEEEQIRRRWRNVKYDDPLGTGSLEDQRSERGGNVEWMQGTPLDASQMERIPEVPTQHTAMVFSKPVPSTSQEMTSSLGQKVQRMEDDQARLMEEEDALIIPPITMTTSQEQRPPTSPKAVWESKSSAASRGSGGRGRVPLFVPSDMMKRVEQGREAFTTHLKRTSHLSYGTFNPWKLIEELSDEILDDIIAGVTEEVSDVVGHYVDNLYAAEFDISAEKTTASQ
ncbi:uncharacterized protein [Diadema antillarum]|uniref:uncharacterized protein n=1 Tax=Diadema antillarum TaxID=105358 RepID=UPI003A8C49EE